MSLVFEDDLLGARDERAVRVLDYVVQGKQSSIIGWRTRGNEKPYSLGDFCMRRLSLTN